MDEWLETVRGSVWDSIAEARAPVVAFCAMVLALMPSGGVAALAFCAWTAFMLAAPPSPLPDSEKRRPSDSGNGLQPLLRLWRQRSARSFARGAALADGTHSIGGSWKQGQGAESADSDEEEEPLDPTEDGFDAACRRLQKALRRHGLPLGLTAMTTFMRVPRACRMALAFAAWASFEVM